MEKCKKYQEQIDNLFSCGLSEEEESGLHLHLDSCSTCSMLYKEYAHLKEDLDYLQEVSPPADFTQNILNALPEEKTDKRVSISEKIRNMFMSPAYLRANLAVVTLLLIFIAGKPYFMNSENDSTPVISADKLAKNFVETRFFLKLPKNYKQTETVAVVGDFNNWDTKSFKLEYKGNGIWEGYFPIKPGSKYEYMFVIDGEKWIPDPKAQEYKEDGFGGKNSILIL